MRLTNWLKLLGIILLMAAVGYGQDVRYNYDHGANFQSYRTYKWVEVPGAVPDQLIDQAIKRAVDEQLAQKGLTKVDQDKDADIHVAYHAAVDQEKSVNLQGTGMGPWGLGPGFGSVQGSTSTIAVGSLFVDVYDSARKQLIWRGEASKTLDIKKDPDKNYRNLQKAMTKLFKNYPPPPNK